MTERAVKAERTGWRDKELSARHRTWGYDAPFADLDFICIEYDMRKVMGLFDYKRETAPWPPNVLDASLQAIADMADRGRVPFFVVRYGRGIDWFEPWCFSNLARKGWAAYDHQRLSEVEWVTFLYKLRARVVPPAVLMRISGRAA